MAEALDLREMRLVPAGTPPHRAQPVASAADRLAMLAAAVAGSSTLVVDRRELDREGPSIPSTPSARCAPSTRGQPLCLCLGMDAFRALDTWHRWRDLRGSPTSRSPAAREAGRPPVARSRELLASAGTTAARRPSARAFRRGDPGRRAPLAIAATRVRQLLAAPATRAGCSRQRAFTVIRERGLYLARR